MDTLHPNPLLAVWTLAQREWVRFIRQRNRVFGAIGQPIIFWLLFGAGLGPTFSLPGTAGAADAISYREYFFPGTLILILLFTAIFTTISIIEDRREGFLQSVLVAPQPRWAMVLGKITGGSLIAMVQGLVFLLLGLTLGLKPALPMVAAIVAFLFVVSVALTGLGFVFAWRLDSSQGFHAIMSVVLFPMWLLSGAFFPASDGVLGWLVRLNPLTYGVAGLRHLLYWGASDEVRAAALPVGLPSLPICVAVTVAFALVTFALSCQAARERTSGDLL
jgi:ABC-2 type transport system permease protein